MEYIDSVRAMQNYIEAHLEETITLADLAKVSLYSPWYSYRLFQEFLEITPSDYIRRLRLSRSALRLKNNKEHIIDIAFSSGYNSVDGYQRAFFKEFGCNPYEYSKNPIAIGLFIPYKVYKKKEIRRMDNVRSIFMTIVKKPRRKVIIKRGIKADNYWDYSQEVGCEIWGKLVSMCDQGEEPVSLWLPDNFIKEGTSKYVQGVEKPLEYSKSVPVDFDVIELPAATYIMFQGEPFAEEDYNEAIEALWTAIKRFNPCSLGYKWDRSNPNIQLEPIGTRGYIELRAIIK